MAGNDVLPTAEHLQDLLLESPGFTEFLLGLTTISALLLGGEEPMLCAITVERGAGPTTVASSTEPARRLDEMQYEVDEGPCLSAVRGQHEVLIPDLQADERWRSYARAVAGEGIRSILAVPIGAEPPARAALNGYSKVSGSFDESLVDAVRQHAGFMSPILRLALRIHLPEPDPEHLRSALRARAVVDAAIALLRRQGWP